VYCRVRVVDQDDDIVTLIVFRASPSPPSCPLREKAISYETNQLLSVLRCVLAGLGAACGMIALSRCPDKPAFSAYANLSNFPTTTPAVCCLYLFFTISEVLLTSPTHRHSLKHTIMPYAQVSIAANCPAGLKCAGNVSISGERGGGRERGG